MKIVNLNYTINIYNFQNLFPSREQGPGKDTWTDQRDIYNKIK